MKFKSSFKLCLQWAVVSIVSLATITGCYRNDLDDYQDQEILTFYYFEDGVKVIYSNDPLSPISFNDGKYQGMLAAIYNNLEYPAEAKANGTAGRVDVQFQLKPNGKVEEVNILTDIGDGCGEAAAEAVRKALGGQPFNPTGLSYDLYSDLYVIFKKP